MPSVSSPTLPTTQRSTRSQTLKLKQLRSHSIKMMRSRPRRGQGRVSRYRISTVSKRRARRMGRGIRRWINRFLKITSSRPSCRSKLITIWKICPTISNFSQRRNLVVILMPIYRVSYRRATIYRLPIKWIWTSKCIKRILVSAHTRTIRDTRSSLMSFKIKCIPRATTRTTCRSLLGSLSRK